VVRRGMSQPGPAGRLMFQSWCCDVIEELTFDDSTIIYTYHIYNYIYITKSSFLAHWPTGIYQDLPGKVTYSVLRWPRPNRNGRTWSRDLESWWPSIYVFTTWRAKNIWITPPDSKDFLLAWIIVVCSFLFLYPVESMSWLQLTQQNIRIV
jgi:hypothetical protein